MKEIWGGHVSMMWEGWRIDERVGRREKEKDREKRREKKENKINK